MAFIIIPLKWSYGSWDLKVEGFHYKIVKTIMWPMRPYNRWLVWNLTLGDFHFMILKIIIGLMVYDLFCKIF